uniref:Rx N-terminal domain-containing protein n=1 Tax=Oryza punctata TaxID=4537 RepID=A0A0E0MH21_ORYPU
MDLVVGASSDAVKSLTGKLGSLLAQEYTLIADVRDDIQYVNDELASMQAFLSKLKRRDVDPDEQRQDWMKQVREVAYDIEDCVDDVGHRLGREPRGSNTAISFRRAWYLLTTLYQRRRIAAEIGNLKLRAQHVSERRTRYGVENLPSPAHGGSHAAGANDDALRDRLAPPLRLIGTMEPIGMEDAMKELERWAFVLASQKFNLTTVLTSLVRQFSEQQAGASQDGLLPGIEEWGDKTLKNKLAEQLKDKRYHILIDDIWSVSAWENIRDSLPKSNKGSSIVVTRRFKSVAEACRRQQGQVYEQRPLPEESSYRLFRQIVTCAPDDPTKKAMTVLKKCGGLPLVIIVVAGLVASKLKSDIKLEVDKYLDEVNNDLSDDLGNNLTLEGVTQILNHCYNHLPADLKTCLLYLTMFPKGCWISRKSLIRKWIAEGFIAEKHGKTVEEVAEDCFNELIGRNLVRPINNSSNGKVLDLEGCKDLSHSNQLKNICDMHQLKYLSLRGTDVHRLPKKIGRLEYLEVLDIRDTEVTKLPASAENLHQMTHLLAGNKTKQMALTLSEGITKMTSIQTFSGIKICGRSTKDVRTSTNTDAEDGDSIGLQGTHKEASKVDVPKQVRSLAALEKLTKLKKLAIYRLEKFQGQDNDLLLSVIEHLSSCSLKFLAIDDSSTGFLDSSLSSSQAPPEHLYTLELSGKLSKVPGWIDRLHNLEKLTLSLTSLNTDTLAVLSSLPELFSLTFSLHAADNDSNALKTMHKNTLESGGKIFVLDEGFEKLKLLRFAAPVLPSLSFLEGPMRELQRLELRFRMVDCMYGLENLSKLQQVFLTVSSQAPEDTKAKISQIKQLASMIQKANNSPNPSVVIDEYNELA